MRVLGIEGTAHTCGVGIVEATPGDSERARVLANHVAMLRPETGGIHPREAADHHVEHVPRLIRQALDEAGLDMPGLDAVAFSQGPGLGPCLRTVATAARAVAVRHGLPLVGVNHCVAHLEIGRATTGCADPVMLYASGANTQVIAEAAGRYRVFGETLDIGIGNALDKFAREQGQPFPGGPEVERLAEEGARMLAESGDPLPPLPYSVKGMDLAFSGLITAAGAHLARGTPLPVVAHALQEWAFAMLVEVTERALAHTGKDEVLLGGGVGRNRRLQAMLEAMAEARGASFHCPEGPLLSDNGAMIAWNGLLAVRSGGGMAVAETAVDQRARTDSVALSWRSGDARALRPTPSGTITGGAEAQVVRASFLGRPVVVKKRVAKVYRDPVVERSLVALRTRREAAVLDGARQAGVPVPVVLDADPEQGALVLDEVWGTPLKAFFEDQGASRDALEDVTAKLGRHVARLHAAGMVHGDLTTSNVLVADRVPVLIDFGLAEWAEDDEARAVDLHVFQETLDSTHPDCAWLWEPFLAAYLDAGGLSAVVRHVDALVARGRYQGDRIAATA